jgi:hypothetical protein
MGAIGNYYLAAWAGNFNPIVAMVLNSKFFVMKVAMCVVA